MTLQHAKIKREITGENGLRKALIMLHGRGGSADDILTLAEYLEVSDFAVVAPQASNHSWYPLSFLVPPGENEPALTASLKALDKVVNETMGKGIKKKDIYFLGFPQGACLMLEFVTRNAAAYGGIVAFTGGLIGDRIYSENYKGDFEGTPVFIGSDAMDRHVPLERVHQTADMMRQMNATVTEQVYTDLGHFINKDELQKANLFVFNRANQ